MSGPTDGPHPLAKDVAKGRRLSLRAITIFIVVAFAATAVGLTVTAYSGIQSRNQSLETVIEQTSTLKLYEDVRSLGFAESAAAASYLSVPQQEFLDRFDESRAGVESSFEALRAQVPQDDQALVQQVNDLEQAHEDLSGAYAAILASLQSGEDEAALQLAEEGDLAAKAERLWTALDASIVGARTAAATAQNDHAAVQKTLDRLVLVSVATWTVVLAVAGVAVYQWVVRPIRRVANAARRIAEGKNESRSPVSGAYEVAGLAQDMNSMADALIQRSEELSSYLSKNLEARTEELARANVALSYQAFHDSLTGLPNRASFTDSLEHALLRSRRSATLTAVLFIDLDNFKAVNDRFGHSAGDEILASLAKRIQGCLRPEDTTARLGGDEFAVILEDIDSSDRAKVVAERILRVNEAPFSYQGQDVFVQASIGVATTDGEQSTVETMLRDADVAMYVAKRDGKAFYQVYDEVMHFSVRRRLELLGEVRAAVERQEFFIQYQPLVDLRTLNVRGFEALVRWNHPRHGIISPADFIPIAEESGAIRPLGLWVLEEGCRQMSQWDQELPGDSTLYLSVNVSVQQLLDREFVDEVKGVLKRTAFDPCRLTLEITESITMYPGDTTMTALNELKKIGARLAIDDFGTGSSSYAYLQHFPFDVVKIDKSFIQEEAAGDTSELTRRVIEMGRALKLEVIAEGIEEESQLEELRDMGCELGQGYLFAKPMDASDVPGYWSQVLARRAA